ncbi:hypothetical protein BJV74DRAFT_887223 [Russula compacta]|nr:hypothetical protein BJV74DRAFT_887223 [Russula compacta]
MVILDNELKSLTGESSDTVAETDTCVGDLVSSPTRNVYPTNYLRVSKQGVAVKGQYVLDLSLPPPPLPARGIDISRKNLSLHTMKGPITAEIWIIHDGSGRSKRVSLELIGDNGLVNATVHDPSSPDGNSHARPSLDVELYANNGDISLSLPRCFRGPITIRTTHEGIVLSAALEECTALLLDAQGTRAYFVGDRPRRGEWGRGNEDDDGDNVGEPLDNVYIGGKHTSVRISWVGEEVPGAHR